MLPSCSQVTYHDETLCCKCCWAEVDIAYDSPAIFDGDDIVISEPVRIDLEPPPGSDDPDGSGGP